MPRLALAALAALSLSARPSPAKPPPDAAARLIGTALTDGMAWARLSELTDGIGPRLTGSPGAAAAVDWALRRLREDGLSAWTEPVKVPHGVRGEERAEAVLESGRRQPLAVTALGGSPGTPPGGIEAEVVEARSLEDLRALGDRARGRIVLFQHDMPAHGGYGDSVRLRSRGPAEAARAGAVGALVRSLATASLRDPHTGQTTFPAGAPAVPAAGISVEDAELLHRLVAKGPVRVKLVLGCGPGQPPEVDSANVVAEIRGREKPEEVVVLAAHLDSWDLATGAVDDGAGVAMVMEAMRAVARLGVAPRRTLRAVLYMNEEDGLSGGIAYADRHASELPRHVAALEADSGAARPLGFKVDAGGGAEAAVGRLAAPLAGIGATAVREGDGGADISPLRYAQVPALGLWQDTAHYFDWHHSGADTLDKVSPQELAASAAAVAAMGWTLAEAAETLPRPDPPTWPPWWKPSSPPVGAAPGGTGAAGTQAPTR